MIVTDDEDFAMRCRSLRNLCFHPDARYVHDEISGNYRFTNLQAAVGLAQSERLDEFIKLKRTMGRYYTEQFCNLPGLILPVPKTEYAENIYWVYGMVLDKDIKMTNREIVKILAEEGVGARTFFWCMHEQPVYIKRGLFKDESYPDAEYLTKKGFHIQSKLALTEEIMEEVVKRVKKVLQKVK